MGPPTSATLIRPDHALITPLLPASSPPLERALDWASDQGSHLKYQYIGARLVAMHGEADQGSPTLNRVCIDFPHLLRSCEEVDLARRRRAMHVQIKDAASCAHCPAARAMM
jgi:hypothetical protein